MTTGLIDVHSHLLPGCDDGCRDIEESIACARRMVQAGYTHLFCTPHIWPSLSGNTVTTLPAAVRALQRELDRAGVPLTLHSGGELNLRADLMEVPPEEIVTYGMRRRYVLADLWAEKLPPFFDEIVRWFQDLGLKLILAHPERMRAVQDAPELADHFAEMGVLLQGNLQCFSDPPDWGTRQVVEQFLEEGRYFMLGSDLHRLETLEMRLQGLERAREIVGEDRLDVLLRAHPALLLE